MTPTQTQTQTQTQVEAVRYWDVMDAWGHASEARRREEWVMLTEQAGRDAVYGRAEVSGGPSLMERVSEPLLFVLAAFVAAGILVAVGRWGGWIQ